MLCVLQGLAGWAYYVLICIIDETKEHLNAHPNPFSKYRWATLVSLLFTDSETFSWKYQTTWSFLFFPFFPIFSVNFDSDVPCSFRWRCRNIQQRWTLEQNCEADFLVRLFVLSPPTCLPCHIAAGLSARASPHSSSSSPCRRFPPATPCYLLSTLFLTIFEI